MSAEATAWAKAQLERREMIPSVERTLLALAKAQPKTGAPVKMTYAQISAQTRDDRRTVRRCIHALVDAGLILKEEGRNKQRQDANSYTLLRGAVCPPQKGFSGGHERNSEMGGVVSTSENSQVDKATTPNARAHAGLGATEESIPLEEMERAVWAGLRVVGGRNA